MSLREMLSCKARCRNAGRAGGQRNVVAANDAVRVGSSAAGMPLSQRITQVYTFCAN
jgi:hypothetical protein